HLGESADLWDDDVVVRAVLWEALRELPPHHRAALVLRYYEDLSDDDIAAALECRPATVRNWVARGLHRLRVQIDDTRTVSKENP
ncbi:MAG: RNA polymerase sigma factor, partial [Nocardioides sp.]